MFIDLIKERRSQWKARIYACGSNVQRFCDDFNIGRTKMSQYMTCDKHLSGATVKSLAKIEDGIKTLEERYRNNEGK